MSGSQFDGVLTADERFAEFAPLQLALADRFCDESCWWYHGPRQYLRALRVVAGIRKDREFLVEAIATSAAGAHDARTLVSGAADAGTLNCVLTAFGLLGRTPSLLVADRCRTPLEVCRAFAGRAGVDIDVHHGDVRTLNRPGAFDVICTHSFLGQFVPADRPALVRQWHRLLSPGGTVVTASRIRPERPAQMTVHATDLPDAPIVRRAIAEIDEASCAELGIARDVALTWANEWLLRKSTKPIRSAAELRALFEAGGFRIATWRTSNAKGVEPARVGLVAERI